MIKVLFVCHGNICRSPMAEFILKDMVAKSGRTDEFYIASCATSSEEIWNGVGNPVYPPAKRELAKHGINCEGKRARQLIKEDYNNYDLLIAMEDTNIRNILRITGRDKDNKVRLLLSFAGLNRGISDPWYTGDFEAAYNDIYMGCVALLEQL